MSAKVLSKRTPEPYKKFYEWMLIRLDLKTTATFDDLKKIVVENETYRDLYLSLRGAVEKLVGGLKTEKALKENLLNFEKDRNEVLSTMSKKLILSQKALAAKKIKWTFTLRGHVINIYEKPLKGVS